MPEETDEQRKRRLEKEEREHDRRKIEEFEKKKADVKPVIDEAKSTHQAQAAKTSKRFAVIKQKFSDTGSRLREGFESRASTLKRGARLSAEDVKEDLSYEVRKKLNQLSEEEQKEELRKIHEKLSVARTQEKYERAKAKVRAANRADNQKVFASTEDQFFGMNMSGLNEQQFFGFGMTDGSSKDSGMSGGFDMEAWKKITSYGGVSADKRPKRPWSGNLMNFGSSGGMKAPSMDDVKAFYNMGGNSKQGKTKGLTEKDIKDFYGM